MRYFSFLVFALVIVGLALPTDQAFARRGGDDDSSESDHRGRGRGGDDSRRDDRSASSIMNSRLLTKDNAVLTGTLEVEANVYTDTTIVKIENSDRKAIFSSTADTKEEVVDVVNEKFGFSKSSIEAVLDFETEDRASRAKERAKISGISNAGGNGSTVTTDAELKARITALQELINKLMAMLSALK